MENKETGKPKKKLSDRRNLRWIVPEELRLAIHPTSKSFQERD